MDNEQCLLPQQPGPPADRCLEDGPREGKITRKDNTNPKRAARRTFACAIEQNKEENSVRGVFNERENASTLPQEEEGLSHGCAQYAHRVPRV